VRDSVITDEGRGRAPRPWSHPEHLPSGTVYEVPPAPWVDDVGKYRHKYHATTAFVSLAQQVKAARKEYLVKSFLVEMAVLFVVALDVRIGGKVYLYYADHREEIKDKPSVDMPLIGSDIKGDSVPEHELKAALGRVVWVRNYQDDDNWCGEMLFTNRALSGTEGLWIRDKAYRTGCGCTGGLCHYVWLAKCPPFSKWKSLADAVKDGDILVTS